MPLGTGCFGEPRTQSTYQLFSVLWLLCAYSDNSDNVFRDIGAHTFIDVLLVVYSSFPVIHKVGNVDIFVLPKFEKYDR